MNPTVSIPSRLENFSPPPPQPTTMKGFKPCKFIILNFSKNNFQKNIILLIIAFHTYKV